MSVLVLEKPPHTVHVNNKQLNVKYFDWHLIIILKQNYYYVSIYLFGHLFTCHFGQVKFLEQTKAYFMGSTLSSMGMGVTLVYG